MTVRGQHGKNQDNRIHVVMLLSPKMCGIIDTILVITNSLQSFIEAVLMIAHSIHVALLYNRQKYYPFYATRRSVYNKSSVVRTFYSPNVVRVIEVLLNIGEYPIMLNSYHFSCS